MLSVLLFLWLVPLRPNLGEAMHSFPFMLKPVEMGILVVASAIVVLRLARPGASLGRVLWVAALVPAIMVAALIFEMASVPRVLWLDRLAGVHWYICVMNMVILSLPVTAALLFGLRYGAPTRPRLGRRRGRAAGRRGRGQHLHFTLPRRFPDFRGGLVHACHRDRKLHRCAGRVAHVALVGRKAGAQYSFWTDQQRDRHGAFTRRNPAHPPLSHLRGRGWP